MPELAEVEFYRKRWHVAAVGQTVLRLEVHPRSRVFREFEVEPLVRALPGSRFVTSEAAAKQIALHFQPAGWLGLHLGMSGELSAQPSSYSPGKHDHLVMEFADTKLVFTDPRMFGRVRFSAGADAPAWWTDLPPALLSRQFTLQALRDFLQARRRAPIKAVLLMQERFPGIGNWMADEILWRAAIHPAQPAGSLSPAATSTLYSEIKRVCRLALRTIAGTGPHPPEELNQAIPRTWLFPHRWADGGVCPRTGGPLSRATIGGRTTCWSPRRQRLRKAKSSAA